MSLSNDTINTKRKVKKCCFIGLPGSGKTFISKKWSRLTGLKRVELDALIEMEMNMTTTQIFSKYGETFFREIESKLLEQVIGDDYLIIDTGGGVIEKKQNRSMIRQNCIVIYLHAPLSTLLSRLTEEERSRRPLILDKPNKRLSALYQKRNPIYSALADITLHTDRAELYLPYIVKWWRSFCAV